MHANAQTSTQTKSGRAAEAGTSIPTINPPTTSENAETKNPLTTTGTARPRKSGSRAAGLTRRNPRVFWFRSPAIVNDIAKMQGSAAYWTAFPIT